MSPKAGQDERSAMRPSHWPGDISFKLRIRDRNWSDFQRISNFLTVRTVNHAIPQKTKTAGYPMNTHKGAKSVPKDQMADRVGTVHQQTQNQSLT